MRKVPRRTVGLLINCYLVNASIIIIITGNLAKSLLLKVEAPIILTVNHTKAKYCEDGIVSSARGYISVLLIPGIGMNRYLYMYAAMTDILKCTSKICMGWQCEKNEISVDINHK